MVTMEWELLEGNGPVCQRAEVFGGWLVLVESCGYDQENKWTSRSTPLFIADPEHQWGKKEAMENLLTGDGV